jgi:hypothetical protein
MSGTSSFASREAASMMGLDDFDVVKNPSSPVKATIIGSRFMNLPAQGALVRMGAWLWRVDHSSNSPNPLSDLFRN